MATSAQSVVLPHQKGFEPSTSVAGEGLGFLLPEIYPGVRGYAVEVGDEIWIPLIEGDGRGDVGKFLDALSPRCVLVNVCSQKLRGMLERRGWKCTPAWDEDSGDVDTWRRG